MRAMERRVGGGRRDEEAKWVGGVGWQELSTRILQQWATIRHAYRLIEQTERRRGAAYAWVIKTRTDVAFFEDLGAIVARSAPDRVHVPRNGMTESLDSRCHNDHLFWCPRHLCRPYFELLEIFESPLCRGATRYAAFNEPYGRAPPRLRASLPGSRRRRSRREWRSRSAEFELLAALVGTVRHL